MKKNYLLLFLLFTEVIFAQTIAIQTFGTGFSSAVDIAHPANDSRLFVVQQGGLIRVLKTDGTTNTTPFLNLTTLTNGGGERGLLGLAFHPNYATNGYFYVDYTNTSGNTVIARYTVSTTDSNVADPASALILMTITQPFSNHNGGCVRFGPDGFLYIGMGDGGSGGDPGNRAQNITENLGKILRLDVDNPAAGLNYGIPADNPYVGIAGNDEIWAIGIRNPWKFSFNRIDNTLWIADVGQNLVEEINKIPFPQTPGLNFGWRCFEGTAVYNNSLCSGITNTYMPIAQYNHSTDGCSITGGYEYTGSLYPNFQNKYFFADYCKNRIGYVNSTTGVITYTPNFTGSNSFVSFGEDKDGELYISNGSTIRKIVDTTPLSTTNFSMTDILMYPNPAQTEFFVKSTNNEINKIELFDIAGKLLLEKNTSTNLTSISIANLQKGIYIVVATGENGYIHNFKLVKE